MITRIYASLGREAGDVEFEVWNEALKDVNATDEEAREATATIIRDENNDRRFPGASVAREAVLALVRRRLTTTGTMELPEGFCGACEGTGWREIANPVSGGSVTVTACSCGKGRGHAEAPNYQKGTDAIARLAARRDS
jgi:hypothetical protein